MSEENKNAPENKAQEKEMTMEEAKNILSRGRLTLVKPIFAGGKELKTLEYDFKKVSGMELIEALDGDAATRKGAFNLSARQAVNLFIAGVIHATDGVNGSDAKDIRNGMDLEDVQKAIQIAVSFFNASSRSGAERISNL